MSTFQFVSSTYCLSKPFLHNYSGTKYTVNLSKHGTGQSGQLIEVMFDNIMIWFVFEKDNKLWKVHMESFSIKVHHNDPEC